MSLGVDGSNTVLVHGSELLRTRPINICAGETSRPVTGVFLSDSKTRCGSVPVVAAFFSARFTVLTVISASPLDCGNPGLECVSFPPRKSS